MNKVCNICNEKFSNCKCCNIKKTNKITKFKKNLSSYSWEIKFPERKSAKIIPLFPDCENKPIS